MRATSVLITTPGLMAVHLGSSELPSTKINPQKWGTYHIGSVNNRLGSDYPRHGTSHRLGTNLILEVSSRSATIASFFDLGTTLLRRSMN